MHVGGSKFNYFYINVRDNQNSEAFSYQCMYIRKSLLALNDHLLSSGSRIQIHTNTHTYKVTTCIRYARIVFPPSSANAS